MSEIITAAVGHPITNMLMREAQAGDMGAADHADAGAVVNLEVYRDKYEAKGEAGDQVDQASGVSGHATDGDQVDPLQAGDDLADHLLEIENLVEGARDAIVRRLEQFDDMDGRVTRICNDMAGIEDKLDRLLSHFGLVNLGS